MCTAPIAFPCAVAEGLSSFDVPILISPSLPITLLLIYIERGCMEKGEKKREKWKWL